MEGIEGVLLNDANEAGGGIIWTAVDPGVKDHIGALNFTSTEG